MRALRLPAAPSRGRWSRLAGVSVAALAMAGPPPVGTAAEPLPPIVLTDAGADVRRLPFARWRPDYPVVNVRVSTRPTRDAADRPAARYVAQNGSYSRDPDGPEPHWRGRNDPLLPGVYYTSIQGDAPSQANGPWTPFRRFRVRARSGEWTGSTSQKRPIRFTRPRPRVLRGLALYFYGRPCGVPGSLSLPGDVRVGRDDRFSARGRGRSRRYIGAANLSIRGRVRGGFARGVLRVRDLFDGGCGTGLVRWSARRR